jgi:glycine oxidase
MYDYLIVGQGISGSLLSHELIQRGGKILVIDNYHKSSSTMVAAGLYNPIVFKRFVKTWMADELIPFAKEKYLELEDLLQEKFHDDRLMLKIFSSEEEKELWKQRQLAHFMADTLDASEVPDKLIAPFGAGKVQGAGSLDTQKFLMAYRKFLKKENALAEDHFEIEKLNFSDEGVSYNDISAKAIVFCEGHLAAENPYFKFLKFKLTKGELLTAEIPGYNNTEAISKGVFVLPVEEGLYKIGATYEWNDLSEEITEKGKKELLDKFQKLISSEPKITEHKAGIRPTVSDRRPLIGTHPEFSHLHIFNGMGTKGVLIAPYFAAHFADFLCGKIKELNSEVNIKRFFKHR